jgi:hypothetical protein
LYDYYRRGDDVTWAWKRHERRNRNSLTYKVEKTKDSPHEPSSEEEKSRWELSWLSIVKDPGGFPCLILSVVNFVGGPNRPEANVFYREAVAPFWQTIKASLERSYANQFVETEQEIERISENINAFLDNLLGPASLSKIS